MDPFDEYRNNWFFGANGADYECFVSQTLNEAELDDYYYGWPLDKAIEQRVEYGRYISEYSQDTIVNDLELEIEYVVGLFLNFDRYYDINIDFDANAKADALWYSRETFDMVIMEMFNIDDDPAAHRFLVSMTDYSDYADMVAHAATEGSEAFGYENMDGWLEAFVANLVRIQRFNRVSEDDIQAVVETIISIRGEQGEYDLPESLLRRFGDSIPALEPYYESYMSNVPLEDIFV